MRKSAMGIVFSVKSYSTIFPKLLSLAPTIPESAASY